MDSAKNSYLSFPCKGKYKCTAKILFDGFGFDQISKSVVNLKEAKQLKTIK